MADILAYVYWLKAGGLGGNPAAGSNLYQSKRCSSCHSPSGPKGSAAAILDEIRDHGIRLRAARGASLPQRV
jgi:hypothetical protein